MGFGISDLRDFAKIESILAKRRHRIFGSSRRSKKVDEFFMLWEEGALMIASCAIAGGTVGFQIAGPDGAIIGVGIGTVTGMIGFGIGMKMYLDDESEAADYATDLG